MVVYFGTNHLKKNIQIQVSCLFWRKFFKVTPSANLHDRHEFEGPHPRKNDMQPCGHTLGDIAYVLYKR